MHIGERRVTYVSKGVIPRSIGETFLKLALNVTVHLRESSNFHYTSFKATLIKHQYIKTPKSTILHTRKTGGMLLLDWCQWASDRKMVRITPSFRQWYEETISELKIELQASLVDLGHKSAFDWLLKEAWNPEQAAMGNSTLPTVCDKLNIMASIHNRELIAALVNELKERDLILEKLEQKINFIENRSNNLSHE